MLHPTRVGALVLLGLALTLAAPGRAAFAGPETLPGEATHLTEDVRKAAEASIAAMKAGPGDACVAARRELLVQGPVVWPVVENAIRLGLPEHARPHASLLKALLLVKPEPEFDALRHRLRKVFLSGSFNTLLGEVNNFRRGLPDPDKPSKRLPLRVKPKKQGKAEVYRSGDGSIVLAFGDDGTKKDPDSPDVDVSDDQAGFLAVVAGRPQPYAHKSGKGGDATATAPQGFAAAWGASGAAGTAGGGEGGEGGAAAAKGGAGGTSSSGGGGAGGPAK